MNNIKILSVLTIGFFSILLGCDDEDKAVLGSKENFKAPVLNATTNTTVTEFTANNGADVYETFEWQNADYGVNASIKYKVEISQDANFSKSAIVKEIEGRGENGVRSSAVSKKEMNDAMLSLGLAAGQNATVSLRIYSFLNGINKDTLYSNVIQRTAKPFRSSDCGKYCTLGIIGSATPGGWDIDTDMRLADAAGVDKSTWTVTLYLKTGEVKFRASDAWENNWGASSFPSGTGTNNGSNIPVATAGYYKVTFNDQTGAYTFAATGTNTFSSMGLIGEQSSWSSDIADLTKSATDPHVWTGTIALTAGKLKFRAQDSWDNNWGGTSFPSDYGVAGGADITIPVSGTYAIYFNDASGEYSFGSAASSAMKSDVGIIGTATPSGWDSDTDLVKNPANGYKWSKIFTLKAGEAKFRAENNWDTNWGASTFPKGTGALGGGNIPVQAGTYFVTFNSLTGEYYFLK